MKKKYVLTIPKSTQQNPIYENVKPVKGFKIEFVSKATLQLHSSQFKIQFSIYLS